MREKKRKRDFILIAKEGDSLYPPPGTSGSRAERSERGNPTRNLCTRAIASAYSASSLSRFVWPLLVAAGCIDRPLGPRPALPAQLWIGGPVEWAPDDADTPLDHAIGDAVQRVLVFLDLCRPYATKRYSTGTIRQIEQDIAEIRGFGSGKKELETFVSRRQFISQFMFSLQ
jgi:hypothetical protein